MSLVRCVSAGLVAVAGAMLVLAGSAAAAPSGGPVRFWSVSKVEQGAGEVEVEVEHGAQVGDTLHRVVDLGHVAFNFLGTPVFDRAVADLFSSADGEHYDVGSQAPVVNPFAATSVKGA